MMQTGTSSHNQQESSAREISGSFRSHFSPTMMPSQNSSFYRGRSAFLQNVYQKVSFGFGKRFRREFACNMVYLVEKKPTKFATTAWMENQIPYAFYRAILLLHAVAVLIWASVYETNNAEVEKWILSLPTWTFILYTSYQCLLMIFVVFQFFADCLCNDDFRWYHKLSWVVQSMVFNSALLCLFGSLVNVFSSASNNSEGVKLTEIFVSNNVNFNYVIGCLMVIDVMMTNITIHILHFVYSFMFYVIYFAFHLYRWGAGYTPLQTALDYGSHTNTSVGFLLITLLLFCPFFHMLAYAIDTLRYFLLINCIARHRKRFIEVSNATEGVRPYTRGRFSGGFPQSGGSYPTTLGYNYRRSPSKLG